MAITTQDGLVSALAAGQRFAIYRASATAEGAGTWHSLWKISGFPNAGNSPPAYSAGSGYVPDRTTTGAIPFTNPGSGSSYLAHLSLTGTVVGTLVVYDRLWACSGFSANSASEQSVTTPGTLTAGRDPNSGADVEPWAEVYTAGGATAATWTLKGTDAAGNTNRNWTYAHPNNAESVGQMMPFFPGGASPAATAGCRVVTSLTTSTTGTAGDIGMTLLRRLAVIPITTANVGFLADYALTGLPLVYNDACLAMMVLCSTTSTGVIQGHMLIAQG